MGLGAKKNPKQNTAAAPECPSKQNSTWKLNYKASLHVTVIKTEQT